DPAVVGVSVAGPLPRESVPPPCVSVGVSLGSESPPPPVSSPPPPVSDASSAEDPPPQPSARSKPIVEREEIRGKTSGFRIVEDPRRRRALSLVQKRARVAKREQIPTSVSGRSEGARDHDRRRRRSA